jgi:hypothetical protein
LALSCLEVKINGMIREEIRGTPPPPPAASTGTGACEVKTSTMEGGIMIKMCQDVLRMK